MPPSPVTDLAFPRAFYEKAIVLLIFKVFFFFLSQIGYLFCSLRRSKELDHLHLSSSPAVFLVSSFIA